MIITIQFLSLAPFLVWVDTSVVLAFRVGCWGFTSSFILHSHGARFDENVAHAHDTHTIKRIYDKLTFRDPLDFAKPVTEVRLYMP